jgi:phthiocerol/phenolphthiocerol synthesis type-I polyketide synthase E
VARGLAETGKCPRLVLLSRTGLPDGATDARTEAIRAELAQLETLGGEVRVIAADVSDRRAVRRALDTAAARFGALHGVFHLAGVPGDGMVHFRDPADIARVLAPKVTGTVVLAEALAGRPPLDFFVSFSSRAAIDGLAGSADYAAANAFQDAYTAVLRRREVPAISINWPSWARVGMAAEYVGQGAVRRPEPGGAGRFEITLGPDTSPLLDEHRIDDAPVMPGTGHVDLAVRGFRATVLDGAVQPVRLWDVVFHRIMVAPAPRRVQALFDRDGERWRFEVRSAPVDAPDDPVVHARGLIAPAHETPAAVDLTELRHRYREPLVLDADEPHRVFTLGPRWHNVVGSGVTPGSDGTDKLVDLALADDFADEVADYALHPTLLDSATSEARRPDEEPHLPFLYQSVLVNGDLPARFSSHIRRRPAAAPGLIVADVTVLGPAGEVLLEIGGYTMRKATNLRSVAAGEMSGEPAGKETTAEPDGIGIEPEAANRLVHALLSSATPGQVAVRPHRDGRPVPLTGAALAHPVANAPQDPAAPVPPPGAPAPVVVAAGPSAPLDLVGPHVPVGPGSARDSVQQRLTQLWLDAFGHSAIGPDEDFFDLGGNSLAAVELMGRIRETIGVDLSIAALFDFPTIRSLAEALRGQGVR